MTERKVRVRFAPSPTGPMHVGGVRTALYNYLFAKKHGGDFILRVEDTDRERFVPGAEEYIIESLKWCGIVPNEGVGFGNGEYAPYRQSERKSMYRKYAEQLVESGHAYYAFDTTEELEEMRNKMQAAGVSSPQYNSITRQNMKNSLMLPADEAKKRLEAGEQYVIRIKMPRNEEVRVKDLIRGLVVVHTAQLDDKVLFKSDGMPTYHLANVVDDYLMKISHVIRGEEWLPSAPLHVLLYKYLGWEDVMPEFAHLPLLLKPDGNGKLSKRDGDRLGFPVFPLQWTDPKTKEVSSGYREKGYFPEAVVNMLALLGWHPSTNQEIFSLTELIEQFSLERVSKSGAKFDPEKAKWFNQHYLRTRTDKELAEIFMEELKQKLVPINIGSDLQLARVQGICRLLKEKANFTNEFWKLGSYFFIAPEKYDEEVVRKKWNEKSSEFFNKVKEKYFALEKCSHDEAEKVFKQTAEESGIKPGDVMQLFRVIITGGVGGPALFEVVALLGKEEVAKRIEAAVKKFGN
ncbi:MAG TPA: glutamate--tRNA ligase [Bacteroidia bacterium]|nr:glutamate--tRNA ligase [Bacteroidia bacterium]